MLSNFSHCRKATLPQHLLRASSWFLKCFRRSVIPQALQNGSTRGTGEQRLQIHSTYKAPAIWWCFYISGAHITPVKKIHHITCAHSPHAHMIRLSFSTRSSKGWIWFLGSLNFIFSILIIYLYEFWQALWSSLEASVKVLVPLC